MILKNIQHFYNKVCYKKKSEKDLDKFSQQQFQKQIMKSPTKINYGSVKSSRSIVSKSSRLTKKQTNEQQKKILPPYFNQDPMLSQIMNRINIKQDSTKQNSHLAKAGTIMADLMGRYQKTKQKIKQLRDDNQKQYEKMYTFTPRIESNSQRYDVKGNVIRRNEIWMREKKKHILQLKEQVTLENLKQCTFSPNLKSRKKSQNYLRNRSASKMSRSLTPKSQNRYYTNNFNSPLMQKNHQSKKDYSKKQYETAKQNLITRMMNIVY